MTDATDEVIRRIAALASDPRMKLNDEAAQALDGLVEGQPALLADEIAMLWMCVRLLTTPEQRRLIIEMRRRMGAPELRAFDQVAGQ